MGPLFIALWSSSSHVPLQAKCDADMQGSKNDRSKSMLRARILRIDVFDQGSQNVVIPSGAFQKSLDTPRWCNEQPTWSFTGQLDEGFRVRVRLTNEDSAAPKLLDRKPSAT